MERPEYNVARSCRTCIYFKESHTKSGHMSADGECTLPSVQNNAEPPWPAHAIGVCAGHTWKARGRMVQKIALKYNMIIPEDTL